MSKLRWTIYLRLLQTLQVPQSAWPLNPIYLFLISFVLLLLYNLASHPSWQSMKQSKRNNIVWQEHVDFVHDCDIYVVSCFFPSMNT